MRVFSYKPLDDESFDSMTALDLLKALAFGLEIRLSSDVDGWSLIEKKLVGRVKGINLEIRSNEHPPLHFHAIGPDINASFGIRDNTYFKGTCNPKFRRIIEAYCLVHQKHFIRCWDELRPSNCPVGAVRSNDLPT